MNGRVYDPSLARFMSPDPVLQSPANSQNYNRYSYVMNNPLRYTDPSGYKFLGGALNWGSKYNPIINTYSALRAEARGDIGGALTGWRHTLPGQIQTDGYLARHPAAAQVVTTVGTIACGFAGPWAPLCAGGVAAYATANYGGRNGDIVKAFAISAASTYAGSEISGYYGNNWDLTRVAVTGLVGGFASVASGGSFERGFGISGGFASIAYLFSYASSETDAAKLRSRDAGFGDCILDERGKWQTAGPRDAVDANGNQVEARSLVGAMAREGKWNSFMQHCTVCRWFLTDVSKVHDWFNIWTYNSDGLYVSYGTAYNTAFDVLYSVPGMPIAGAVTLGAYAGESPAALTSFSLRRRYFEQ